MNLHDQIVRIAREARQAADSLGAKMAGFDVPAELAVGEGGYARALPPEWLAKEREALVPLLQEADIVILSALVPGEVAPVLITEDMLLKMKPGSVIVDVAVDQGGCIETIHPTYHTDPVYFVDGVVHYGVANMPGAVCRTSTIALTNATLPYAVKIADMGYAKSARADRTIWTGINMLRGTVNDEAVARAFKLRYTPLEQVLPKR